MFFPRLTYLYNEASFANQAISGRIVILSIDLSDLSLQ